jgi:hypothetical protein
MNPTQLQTTLAPIITVLGTLLAARIPFFDAGTWGQILGGIVAFAGVIWGAFAARSSAVISTTANLAEVSKVQLSAAAPQSLVDATPANVTK